MVLVLRPLTVALGTWRSELSRAERAFMAWLAPRAVLVVGGNAWARSIAEALKSAGLGVRLWTGRSDEQAAAREVGLAAGNARLGVDLASREEELEEVTDALLMTESDDFNALAAFELRQELGRDHVVRLLRADPPVRRRRAAGRGGE